MKTTKKTKGKKMKLENVKNEWIAKLRRIKVCLDCRKDVDEADKKRVWEVIKNGKPEDYLSENDFIINSTCRKLGIDRKVSTNRREHMHNPYSGLVRKMATEKNIDLRYDYKGDFI